MGGLCGGFLKDGLRDMVADLTAEEMDPFLSLRGSACDVFGESADFLFGSANRNLDQHGALLGVSRFQTLGTQRTHKEGTFLYIRTTTD
jgi:hypothetical protein